MIQPAVAEVVVLPVVHLVVQVAAEVVVVQHPVAVQPAQLLQQPVHQVVAGEVHHQVVQVVVVVAPQEPHPAKSPEQTQDHKVKSATQPPQQPQFHPYKVQ
jgi:hypothetical protein